MHRFTPRQALENAAFIAALRRTGNPRLAAAELGVHRSTYLKRRAESAAFAAQWDAAILACHAALTLAGGPRPPEGTRTFSRKSTCPHSALRTQGGEIAVGRTRGGRLQLRRSPPGRMIAAAEQAFFAALAASANIRLSAAAVGFTHSAFYQKKHARPAFAAEMKLSLTIGYDRVECASMERTLQALHGGGADNAWLDHAIGDDNPIPTLTWEQAFQQLCLHRNTVRLDGDRPPGRRAHIPESPQAAFHSIARKIDAIKRAIRYEATGSWRFTHEPPPAKLPPLRLVTGWSRASGKPRHNPKLALFGGWRIEDWEKRERERRQWKRGR